MASSGSILADWDGSPYSSEEAGCFRIYRIVRREVKEGYRNFRSHGATVAREYDNSRITFYDDRKGIILFYRGASAKRLIADATILSKLMHLPFTACAVYTASKLDY